MSDDNQPLHAWNTCTDCGYEGKLEYFRVAGEDYDDPNAMGVMLLLHCPACGSREHTLIEIDYYRDMVQAEVGQDEAE